MAAQPGRGTFADAAAVPLADGGTDNYPEEVRQDSQTARIYGMTLCKTEKFPGSPDAAADTLFPVTGTVSAMVFRQYMAWMPMSLF